MARPAPGAQRVVHVTEFLARHRGESFTLSELARRLHLNKATAHALVHTLVDEGWLMYQPDRTVSLGPGLVAVGEAANASFQALAPARTEARALSERTGRSVVLSTILGDDIVILVGSRDAPSGERVPLEPPMGSVFLAWAPPVDVERWLTATDGADRDMLLSVLTAVHDRGFAVGLQAGSRPRLAKTMARLHHPEAIDRARPAELRRMVRELLDDLGHEGPLLAAIDPESEYLVDHIAAPVFGPGGAVELAMTVVGFNESLTGRAIVRAGRALRAAADRATASRGGS